MLILDLRAGAARPPSRSSRNDVIDSVDVLTGRSRASWPPEVRRQRRRCRTARPAMLLARVLTPQHDHRGRLPGGPGSVLIVDVGLDPVYEWDTDLEHAVDFACRVAGRDLTEAEWAAQFPRPALPADLPAGPDHPCTVTVPLSRLRHAPRHPPDVRRQPPQRGRPGRRAGEGRARQRLGRGGLRLRLAHADGLPRRQDRDRSRSASGILNIYSRTPGALLQTAAGLDNVSGGRAILGLGRQRAAGDRGLPRRALRQADGAHRARSSRSSAAASSASR